MFNPIHWVRSGLRPEVTILNLFFYMLSALLSICFFVFVNASQAFILTNVIAVPVSNLGRTTGSLALYDELISLVSVVLWGILSDKSLGRRAVYSIGFMIIGISVIAFPFANDLYPQLLVIRLVFAVGAASTSAMLTAVLADFCKDEKRGIVAGGVGLVSGLGALLALFLFLPMPINLQSSGNSPIKSIRITYAIVGSLAILFGSTLWFFINPPKDANHHSPQIQDAQITITITSNSNSSTVTPIAQDEQRAENHSDSSNTNAVPPSTSDNGVDHSHHGKSPAETVVSSERTTELVPEESSVPSTKSYFALAKEGIFAAKNPKVLLGYIGGFAARADSIILTLFITLYVNQYYLKKGSCSPFDRNLPSGQLKRLCPVAFRRASILSGTAQTCALIGALIFGALCQKISHELSLAAASLIGLVGFVIFSIVDDAEGTLPLVGVVFMGFGQIGMIVVSLALVTTSQVKRDVRGSVAGMYSLFGAIGILLCSRLGGALFDSWRRIAPFVLLAVFHALSFIASLAAWGVERYKIKQRVS